MTVCDAPESTNARNSIVPARTLTVGWDFHVGSLYLIDIPSRGFSKPSKQIACVILLHRGLLPGRRLHRLLGQVQHQQLLGEDPQALSQVAQQPTESRLTESGFLLI